MAAMDLTTLDHLSQDELWDARAAAAYDTPGEGMQAPEVLGPTVDRLAELAGMHLESRHADWSGGEFTADSTTHISVYRR